jgi:ABC-type uncharacterized transport system permease subunit
VSGDIPRWRRLLQRLMDASPVERILISLAALAMSILVGAVIVVVSGLAAACEQAWYATALGGEPLRFCYDPLNVYSELFLGAFGHPLEGGWDPFNFRVAVTLQETTLLIFTGLSVAVAFRAGLFNIGTQGQLVLGALATALAVLAVAPLVPGGLLGTAILVTVGITAGAVAGGAWGALPGALKAYADANEVITTIMLNTVAANVAFFLVASYFQPETTSNTQTADLPGEALIPNLPFGVAFQSRDGFSLPALAIAVAFVLFVYYLFAHLAFGYDLRTSGLQPEAAAFSGVNAKGMTVASMTLSGALGGVGGAVFVLMVEGKFLTQVPALGFDGITVAILAGNNPLGVGFAALLFGILKSGALAVDFATDIPQDLIGVLRGLIILFVAMPEFFRMAGARFVDTSPPGGRDPDRTDGSEDVTDGDADEPPAAAADGGTDDTGTDDTRGTGGNDG